MQRHKLQVINKAGEIFGLTSRQKELLANTAGLSLGSNKGAAPLPALLQNCSSQQRRLLYHSAVSERMLQYYLSGRQPSKQALLAILILLKAKQLANILPAYGYCLSHSLANDTVVRWYLNAAPKPASPAALLLQINQTLSDLDLPLLMTKQFKK